MTNTYSMDTLDNYVLRNSSLAKGYRVTADNSSFLQLQDDEL